MGQSEILQLLASKKNKWFTSSEIANILKIKPSSISMNCKRLRKHKAVNFKLAIKNETRRIKHFVYQYKRRRK